MDQFSGYGDNIRLQTSGGLVVHRSQEPRAVIDLWVRRWRARKASGDVIVVRFADDFVMGFQHSLAAEARPAGRSA